MKIQYTLGTNCYTPIYELNEEYAIMERQLQLSFPIITSVKFFDSKKRNISKQIFVGKEIDLQNNSARFWLEKYELSFEDISDIYLQGFKKACLLNYKKYDQIVVGMKDNDEVVPDYFALKEKIKEWKNGCK